MRNLLKIFIAFFVIIFFSISQVLSVWAIYKKLTPKTLTDEVEKFQQFFKELDIYKWNIDWVYENIKPYISSYQVKNGIIPSESHSSAWYVWDITYAHLKKTYWDTFTTTYTSIFWEPDKGPEIWNDTYFIVSAYYSPLRGQKRYSTWTYAGDIRLNGEGTHWASWAAVHAWFIAAPSTYSYGTKIYVEWLWIWVVEDRWGAIVKAWVRWHEYDRLDIWMWYGDAGLTRALNWWKRAVKWKILARSTPITMNFNVGYTAPPATKVDPNILAIKIYPTSTSSAITTMQKLFKEAGFYSWNIDGKYVSFENAIIDFQIREKIITVRNGHGAWYIGNKTLSVLLKKYAGTFTKNWKDAIAKKTTPEKQEVTIAKTPSEKNTSPIKVETSVQEVKTNTVELKHGITAKQKKSLDSLYTALHKKLEEKAWWSDLQLASLKRSLKRRLTTALPKIKDEVLKKKIFYLVELLQE